MDTPVEALRAGLADLEKSEQFSDLTITCGPYSFKVHQAILRTQTEYFQAIAAFKEGDSKVIELKAIGSDDSDDDDACDDLVAIKHMVHFFYHLDYDVQPAAKRGVADPLYPVQLHSKALASLARSTSKTPATADTDSTMTMHAKVFAAAVKYQVPALQVLAASKFASAVRSFWSHQTFAEAVRIVYHTTPDDVQELREVVADAITTHEELLDKPEIKTAVLEINGLAYELLRKKSKSVPQRAALAVESATLALPAKHGVHFVDEESVELDNANATIKVCGCRT